MTDTSQLIGTANKDRFFAAICDNLLALVTGLLVASVVGQLGDLVPNLVVVITYFAYFLVSEGLLSTTPGKLLCGLRIRKLSGEPCTWSQAAIRTLCRVFEVNPLLLGALPAGITILATSRRQRQTIGDS